MAPCKAFAISPVNYLTVSLYVQARSKLLCLHQSQHQQ